MAQTMNFSNATDSGVTSAVNAAADLLNAAVDVLGRAARLQLLGVALEALLHLRAARPTYFSSGGLQRGGHLGGERRRSAPARASSLGTHSVVEVLGERSSAA